MMQQADEPKPEPKPADSRLEHEHTGPWYTHPYVLYLAFTALLFVVLILLAWLGWKSGFVANTG